MKTRYVVLGSGYAGTLAAIRLAWHAGPGCVQLVDPELQLVERVRLHEALVRGRAIAHPLGPMVEGLGIELVRGRAQGIAGREVVLEDGRRLPFDRCIVATGSSTARATPGSMEHAQVLEPSTVESLRARLAAASRVVVLGGGLTGVEIATEIAEAMPQREVVLVSRSLAPCLTTRARAHVERALARLGVALVLGDVDRIDARTVYLGDRTVSFDLAIDTLGFASQAPAFLTGERDAQGRIVTDAALRSPGRPEMLLAGDLAAPEGTLAGSPMIRGCQSAMPSGAHAADVALADARGWVAAPFVFLPNGYCVSLGRHDGVIDTVYGAVLTGRPAVWIKEQITRYTVASMTWQARGFDYRFRPWFRRRAVRSAPRTRILAEGTA